MHDLDEEKVETRNVSGGEVVERDDNSRVEDAEGNFRRNHGKTVRRRAMSASAQEVDAV